MIQAPGVDYLAKKVYSTGPLVNVNIGKGLGNFQT